MSDDDAKTFETSWHVYYGMPPLIDGVEHDFYLDRSTGNVYFFENGEYLPVVELGPLVDTGDDQYTAFLRELSALINKYSLEGGSDTPDYIIAEYLYSCLMAYNMAVKKRTAHSSNPHRDSQDALHWMFPSASTRKVERQS